VPTFLKPALVCSVLLALAGTALAGARPPDDRTNNRTPLDMRNMTDDQVRRRIQDACVFRLSEREQTIKTNAVTRCGCYAGNLMRAMSKDELAELRETGVFAKATRPKAEAALKACKV
jgi:hypothetical protein